MTRYGITYEAVEKAAKSLVQQRQNPTVEKVRVALGSTGSFATISKHLNSWRAKYFTSKEVPTVSEESTAPNEVNQAINTVWEQLNTQAQQQVEKIKQESEAKITIAQEEKVLAQQERAEAIQALEKAKTKINHLEADLTLVKKELIEMRAQCGIAQEKATNKEEAFNSMTLLTQTHLQDIKSVHAEALQNLHQQVETLKKSYEKTIQEWKDLIEKQRVDYMMKTDELKLAKEKTEKALVKTETELQHQSLRFKEMEEQVRGVSADLAIAQQHQQEAAIQVIKLQVEIEQKDKRLMELTAQIQKKPSKFKVASEKQT